MVTKQVSELRNMFQTVTKEHMRKAIALDKKILLSSLWCQPDSVLRVWVALLAGADETGWANYSILALAHICQQPIEKTAEIIDYLSSPDPCSRLSMEEGRRIIPCPEGGWEIVNYSHYQAKLESF